MLERTYNAVKEYLEYNTEEALNLAQQMNCEDGSFDWCDVYDFEELCEIAAGGGADAVYELVQAAVNGETYGGMVRYDAYANLIPGDQEDLLRDAEDYLSDIMNVFADYVDDDGYVNTLAISNDLQEVIEDSLKARIRVYNIIYDLDEEDKTPEVYQSLQKELILPWSLTSDDPDDIDEEELVDIISDETGWCVESYSYEILPNKED